MSFISYAQNFEDVMLWRALQHVRNGFYVDVGAQQPEIDSVTKAFYDRGWRGINIEPVAEWFEMLSSARPCDTNLRIAVGKNKGRCTFYEIPGTGLSTFDKATAERHASERGFGFRKIEVPVETLTAVIEVSGAEDIHFLKIDAEGAEKAVIEGLDLARIRPWIIVVESTSPNLNIETSPEWGEILAEANYRPVYFDGLNRFYIASEHAELGQYFLCPPNPFDQFELAALVMQRQRAEQAEVAVYHWQQQANLFAAEVEDLRSSASWQITAPLRLGQEVLRTFVLGAVRWTVSFYADALGVLRYPLGWLLHQVARHPRVAHWLNLIVSRFPLLHARLLALAGSLDISGAREVPISVEPGDHLQVSRVEHLGRCGRSIANDLLHAAAARSVDRKP